ncbi:TolC family protein, partial [candidate division KSB1 bacterium]|nr:TolC family protein [candidate division KSB1 bacterium]
MKKVLSVFLLLLLTSLIIGQEEQALTLQDCIEIALRNNSTLRVAKSRYSIAGTNVTTAYSNLLPHINLSLGSGKYIQGARTLKLDVPADFDSLTGRVIYEQQEIYQKSVERNSHSARLSLNQNIFDFGQSIYNIKYNKALQKASEQTVQGTVQAVIFNVKQAYYEQLKTIKLKQVYQEAVQLSEDEYNRAKAMMEIGISSQAEVLQARVSLGNARTNLITQKNVVEVARANLNYALGRDPSTPVSVIEDETEPIFPTITLEDALQTATQNNTEIKALELQAKSSLYSLRMAQTRYLPSIGANVTYSRNNDDIARVYSEKLDEDFSVSIGLGLDLNIFNGLADKAAVQRMRLTHQIDQENLKERKRILTAEVKQYFIQFSAYKEFLEINQQNIEAAKENLRLQQEKRRVGSGTELEVTQAQVEVTRAQANLVR